MKDTVIDPLRIGAIGLDERRCNALSMIFEGACKKGFCFANDRPPEAWIVDLDQVGAVDALIKKWKSHGKLPALFLSLNEPVDIHIEGEKVAGAYLKKPFRVDEFVAMLPTLAKAARQVANVCPPAPAVDPAGAHRIESGRLAVAQQTSRVADLLNDEASLSLAGNAADIDLSDAAQHEQIYYAPERFLQGLVAGAWLRAKEAGRPLALEGAWPGLILFPLENKVQLTGAMRQYRPFAIVPDLKGAPREVLLNPNIKPAAECVSYESFIWTLALWAARGRLPRGTPLEHPVFLRWWPNFTRLDVSPSALAISALWSRQPHSLALTVDMLHVPQRWVFAFYSAAHAIGLAAISHRAVDQMTLPTPPRPTVERRAGFLGRVLGHLKLAR